MFLVLLFFKRSLFWTLKNGVFQQRCHYIAVKCAWIHHFFFFFANNKPLQYALMLWKFTAPQQHWVHGTSLSILISILNFSNLFRYFILFVYFSNLFRFFILFVYFSNLFRFFIFYSYIIAIFFVFYFYFIRIF